MITNYNSFYVAGEMIDRRAMLSIGEPIGSPYLPPFKQRQMPFAPLAGAFAAVGAASGAIATGLAVVNLVGVAAMYAGVAMTVTGLITGDKGLMKLGGIVGLAGGVASLAAGGIASLAAGGELSMGTAGINSLNASNAAAANSAALASGGAVTGQTLAQQTSTALGEFTGKAASEAATATAQMSPVAGNLGTVSQAVGQGSTGMLQASPLIGNTGAALTSSQALATGGVGGVQAAAGSGGFFNELIGSMTPKDWVLAGGAVLSGGAKAVAANEANAQRQQQFEYEQGIRNQQIKNLNSVPMLTAGPAKALGQQ